MPLRRGRRPRGNPELAARQGEALAATRPRGLVAVVVAAAVAFVGMFVFVPLVLVEIPLVVASIVMLLRWLAKAGRYRLQKAGEDVD